MNVTKSVQTFNATFEEILHKLIVPKSSLSQRLYQDFTESSVTQLTENERIVFFILYLIMFSLSMVANIATLFTTYQRKIRLMQKFLIISLAISDIIVCIFFGINNMINFSHPWTNWILGDFMCSFVPYMQIVGSVANSLTMASIALDRYRNIVHPSNPPNKTWDPNIWLCIALLIVLWGVSTGVSYPMMNLNQLVPVRIWIVNPYTHQFISIVHVSICMTKRKKNHFSFYCIIFSIIFIPMMILFLWLYYKIAELIWKRRKPVSTKSQTNNASVTMETSTDSKTSVSKQSPVTMQINKGMKSLMKNTKLHMERKIRTFKIILVIMLVFFVCRMPHWIYSMIKFAVELNEPKHWIIGNALSFLLVVNTTLNPFLYSFLNQTIMYFDKFFFSLGDFISKICCCCCSNTEFDNFEKDNPFPPEMYEPRPSQTSSIIPRGPHMDGVTTKPNHVKFHDVAVINVYPYDNEPNLICNTF